MNEAVRNCVEPIVWPLAKQYGVTEQREAENKWNGYGRCVLARHKRKLS